MNFFDIKFFHLMLSVLYIFGLMTATYNPQMKMARVFYYFVCLMFFVSGFMSMDRLGLVNDQAYPMWLVGKMVSLGVLFIAPSIIIKKLPKLASKLNCVFIAIAIFAIYLGVYKP